jgi:outer membrane protein assembly factor BamB
VNETTGALAWTAPVIDGGFSAPAVTADGVYVSYACQLYDFQPSTGEQVWHYSTGCYGGGGETPIVSDGVLYSPDFVNYTGESLNAETGALLGQFTADLTPAFLGKTGFFLHNGILQGIDTTTNTVLWSFTGDGLITSSSPIVVNNIVFISSLVGNVYALDATTGAQLWTTSVPANVQTLSGPTVPFVGLTAGDGLLLVPSTDVLTAFTLSTSP